MENTGFIPQKPEKGAFKLGAAFGSTPVIKQFEVEPKHNILYTGHGELQKNPAETMSCVSQSAVDVCDTYMNIMIAKKLISYDNKQWLQKEGYLEPITQENEDFMREGGLPEEEILQLKRWGKMNSSDRAWAELSGTSRSGNSFVNVWDAGRHAGLIAEKKWSQATINSWEEYYKDIPADVLAQGQEFLKRFEIFYETIPKRKFIVGWVNNFSRMFKYGPIQIAVYAWGGTNNFYEYIFTRNAFNHATQILDHPWENGRQVWRWVCKDSYKAFIKYLTNNFNMYYWGYQPTIVEKKNDMKRLYTSQAIKPTVCEMTIDGQYVEITDSSYVKRFYGKWEDIEVIEADIKPEDIVDSINTGSWFVERVNEVFGLNISVKGLKEGQIKKQTFLEKLINLFK